ELPSPTRAEERKGLRRDEILVAGPGAGGVERRVLEEPDAPAGPTVRDRRDPRLHLGDRVRIGDEPLLDGPFHRRAAGPGEKRAFEFVADVYQRFTLFCSSGPRGFTRRTAAAWRLSTIWRWTSPWC